MCEHKNIRQIKDDGKFLTKKCYECGYVEKIKKKTIKKKSFIKRIFGR